MGIGGALEQRAQKANNVGPFILPDTDAVPCSPGQPIRENLTEAKARGQPQFDASSGLRTKAKLPDSSDDQAAQRSTPEPAHCPIHTAALPGPQHSPAAVATREGIAPHHAKADAPAEGRTDTAQQFKQPMQWDAATSEGLGSPDALLQSIPLLPEVCCKNLPGVRSTPDATVLVPPDTSIVVRTQLMRNGVTELYTLETTFRFPVR